MHACMEVIYSQYLILLAIAICIAGIYYLVIVAIIQEWLCGLYRVNQWGVALCKHSKSWPF